MEDVFIRHLTVGITNALRIGHHAIVLQSGGLDRVELTLAVCCDTVLNKPVIPDYPSANAAAKWTFARQILFSYLNSKLIESNSIGYNGRVDLPVHCWIEAWHNHSRHHGGLRAYFTLLSLKLPSNSESKVCSLTSNTLTGDRGSSGSKHPSVEANPLPSYAPTWHNTRLKATRTMQKIPWR